MGFRDGTGSWRQILFSNLSSSSLEWDVRGSSTPISSVSLNSSFGSPLSGFISSGGDVSPIVGSIENLSLEQDVSIFCFLKIKKIFQKKS